MARRVKDLDAGVPELDTVTVLQGCEREDDIGRLVQAVKGILPPRQRCSSGAMISVHVRVYHMCDAHALAGCERFVRLQIVSARVNDRASAERATAKQVGGAAAIEVIVGAENHRQALLTSRQHWRVRRAAVRRCGYASTSAALRLRLREQLRLSDLRACL